MIKLLSSYLINIIYRSNRITCDERAIYEYLINAKSCCMTIAVCVTICSISVIIGFIENRRLNNAF